MMRGTNHGRAEHWNQVYERRGETEVSWYQREPRCSLELFDALGLELCQSVIDVGGGASTLVDALLYRSVVDVSVLDVSSTALQRARVRLGKHSDQVQWLEQDLLTWRPQRRYDIWHDRAVFHFLTEAADRDRYRETLRRATRTGSHVVIGTFAADGPDHCSGLPVARYDPNDLVEVLGSEFTPVLDRREKHSTPDGALQPFTWVAFARS